MMIGQQQVNSALTRIGGPTTTTANNNNAAAVVGITNNSNRRRVVVDLVRWTILVSVLLLSSLTFSNLIDFQKTLDNAHINSAGGGPTAGATFLHLYHHQHYFDELQSRVTASSSASEHHHPNRIKQQAQTQKSSSLSSHPMNKKIETNHRVKIEDSVHPTSSSKLFNTTTKSSSSNPPSVVEYEIFHPNRSSYSIPDQDTTLSPVIDDGLPCIVHGSMKIDAEQNRVSDPKKTVLEHQQIIIENNTTSSQQQHNNNNPSSSCGRLRRDWRYHEPQSKYAKILEAHQTDCNLPLATHHMDNTYGFGAHLTLWGQALCNVYDVDNNNKNQQQYRMRSTTIDKLPWIWMDQEHCDLDMADSKSPLLCYFPNSEYRCSNNNDTIASSLPTSSTVEKNASDPRVKKDWCQLIQNSSDFNRREYRAGSTEYLFQRVSNVVIQEAKRQMGIIFADNNGIAPSDLITVHMRWGDKFWEMDLPKAEEYIDAVKQLLPNTTSPANVYLATEDPIAYWSFIVAKPTNWHVYADITLQEINPFRPIKGNRASWATKNTKGRAGLLALASILVAMEANAFVLTTKSNWSTIMDHLRTNIINPHYCGGNNNNDHNNCTRAIDLRPGIF